MCSAAPHAEFSGDPGLHQFVSKNKEFVIRIKADLVALNRLVVSICWVKRSTNTHNLSAKFLKLF